MKQNKNVIKFGGRGILGNISFGPVDFHSSRKCTTSECMHAGVFRYDKIKLKGARTHMFSALTLAQDGWRAAELGTE